MILTPLTKTYDAYKNITLVIKTGFLSIGFQNHIQVKYWYLKMSIFLPAVPGAIG